MPANFSGGPGASVPGETSAASQPLLHSDSTAEPMRPDIHLVWSTDSKQVMPLFRRQLLSLTACSELERR